MSRPADQGLAAAALAQQTEARLKSIRDAQAAIDEAQRQIEAAQAEKGGDS